MFGYEINIFSDHTKLVYGANQSEYKRMMGWKLILKEFEIYIQHIFVVDNIVSDRFSIFTYTSFYQYYPITSRDLSQAKRLPKNIAGQSIYDGLPLDLAKVQQEKKNN